MNEGQNYSIIHFDMFDKGTVVFFSFASVSHSTQKRETSTLRSQTVHVGVKKHILQQSWQAVEKSVGRLGLLLAGGSRRFLGETTWQCPEKLIFPTGLDVGS